MRSQYHSPVDQLVTEQALSNFGCQKADLQDQKKLAAVDASSLFENQDVVDWNLAKCCLSGLWLLYNFLDQSHEISQAIKTPEGSYWHGIMHRLEGDYWNSKYWHNRAGIHSTDSAMQDFVANEFAHVDDVEFRKLARDWNQERFVDFCESHHGQAGELGEICHQIEVRQWQLLFDFCCQNAVE
jgi:hypothetical protein